MVKIKKLVSVLMMFLCLNLFLTGCYGRIELEDLGIIVAMGIDKENEGFIMTLHIIRPLPGGEGASVQEETIWVGSSTGQSLFDTSTNFRARAAAQLTWMHNRVIIIGEEAARDGLHDILDFLTRNREIRYESWLLITEGKAKDALQVTPELQPTFYEQVQRLIENQDEWAKQETNRVKDLAISLNNPYKDIVTARMILITPEVMGAEEEENEQNSEESSRKTLILDGAAVVKGTKLTGWLTKTETRSLLFLEGKAKEALIIVPFNDGKVSVEVQRVDTSIKPGFRNGKPWVEVEISGIGRIAETDVMVDFADLKSNAKLERILGERIAGEIRNSIAKFQGEYNADILGIGDLYYRSHTHWWKQNRDKWFQGLYQEVGFDLRVDIGLDNSGLLLQPIIEGRE